VTNHDEAFKAATEKNRNMMVPWYLMAAWAYYCADEPIITDGSFDFLCFRLDIEWGQIEHWHKHLVDREQLQAGTCLKAEGDYPEIIKGAARSLMTGLKRPDSLAKRRADK
jgi:hypothetical protein